MVSLPASLQLFISYVLCLKYIFESLWSSFLSPSLLSWQRDILSCVLRLCCLLCSVKLMHASVRSLAGRLMINPTKVYIYWTFSRFEIKTFPFIHNQMHYGNSLKLSSHECFKRTIGELSGGNITLSQRRRTVINHSFTSKNMPTKEKHWNSTSPRTSAFNEKYLS